MKWTITLVIYFSLFPLLLAEEMTSISFNSSEWKLLKFKSIPANQVEFLKDELKIKVNGSASPLIYPLKNPKIIKELHLGLEVNGKLNLQKQLQGSKNNDDFIFRIGLVYQGKKTLSLFQKMIAPTWVKTLHALAKDTEGIDNIIFYNLYSDHRLAKKQRVHPHSELLLEKFEMRPANKINKQIAIEDGRKVIAFWISSDGDDTNSQYEVKIKELKYR